MATGSVVQSTATSGTGYCKLSDGTLMQWGYINKSDIPATQSGSLYTGEFTDVLTFPYGFYDNNVGINITPTYGSYQMILGVDASSTRINKIIAGRPTSGNISGKFRWIAIGRWKA